MAMTSVLSVSLVLFVLGLFGLLSIHIQSLTTFVKENLVLQIYLREDASAADINRLYQGLKKSRFAKDVTYVSKDSAVSLLNRDLGEDFIGFLDYNPLMASFNVHLHAKQANTDSIVFIRSRLTSDPVVKEVFYQENALLFLNRNVDNVILIFAAFSLLLLIASLFIINHSVRLSLFSHRFLIKTMQLVGATKAFIRRPYLVKGLTNGLLAGIVSVILLIGVLILSNQYLPELNSLRNDQLILFLMLALILGGVLISFLSTISAINKYLNRNVEDLY